MSYIEDWKNNILEANEVETAYIKSGNTETNILSDISVENFVFARGTADGVYKSLSQDTLTVELKNDTHKYDNFNFKGKELHIDVITRTENVTYLMTYYNLKITNATFTDEHVLLETNIKNLNASRLGWDKYGAVNGTSHFTTLNAILNNAMGYGGYPAYSGDINSFANGNATHSMPSYYYEWDDYMREARVNFESNASFINQIMQLLGGFAYMKRGDTTPYLSLKHFPKPELNSAISTYVYGGTFDITYDESEELTLEPSVESEEIDVSECNRMLVEGEPLGTYPLIMIADGTSQQISSYYNNKLAIDVSNVNTVKLVYPSSSTSLNIVYLLFNTYVTGDNLDGNTDSKDGGTLDIPYIVIDDDVLIELTIGDTYYRPTGIKAVIPIHNYDPEVDPPDSWEDKDYTYGDQTNPLDLSENNILKIFPRGARDYSSFFSNLYNYEMNFASMPFEATVINNLWVDLGDMVAICSGYMPTRFSYIEDINSDINGSTILSNSRGGE